MGVAKPIVFLFFCHTVFCLPLDNVGDVIKRWPKVRSDPDPEINLNCLQLIQYWGYPGEQHVAQTSDGYLLHIQRIPHGKAGPTANRPVVFLQHGLEGLCSNWLTNLPSESAGYIFADAGFDVWLGNFRGTKYGMNHVTLSSKDHEFWEFSWDEMAAKDLEAMINLALEVSGATQLYYVGHSEGTLTAFAKFSSDLEFAKKIKKFFALGPVVTVKHIKGPIAYIAPFTKELSWLFGVVGIDAFQPHGWFMDLMNKMFCEASTLGDEVCENIFFLIGGPNSHQTNLMVNSGLFQMYDYGEAKNLAKYGKPKPPLYDLLNMEVPVALFWGDLDWLADPKDVKNSILPYVQNLIGDFELADFNHLDFIWGLNAATEVYEKVITMIKEE